MKLPSIRSLFIPDPGYVILDVDLVIAIDWRSAMSRLPQ